jgi:NAD(P)-dependent dehydrogenase (short-subunit alcohol dehydrogenase family)
MFRDDVVLITGAASGIGYAASRLFVERGAAVIGADLDEAVLGQARAPAGPRPSAREGGQEKWVIFVT